MAATLRKTFRYPDDDHDQDPDNRQELDEEEQDKLIQELSAKNDAQNAFYHLVFTIVPLVAIVAYIPAIFSSSLTTGTRFTCIICILSLSTTAYMMKVGPFDLKERRLGEPGVLAVQEGKLDPRGYLIYINTAMCVLLFLKSWYTSSGQGHDDHQQFILDILPGVVLGAVVIASRSLIEVDIGELQKLRYEYKGA
ncbi:hypothetical protein PISL3812_02592 [Talaromyces islandicus]|uniref:Uncharacterized protein n=1 Tax=Talaromyces islandicus TaxID=28573 RepID=A0A0U1LSL4_TALIS|nr:hypothetical protein PISL3812_02592 [Talaromyces islandicus]